MKATTMVGIILIILGVLGFIFGSINYTDKETIVDAGPIEIEAEHEETVPIPQILSGIAVAGGIVLVAVGAKKK